MRFAEWHELEGKTMDEVRAGNRAVLIEGDVALSFALNNDALTADLEDVTAPSDMILRAAKLLCAFGYLPR